MQKNKDIVLTWLDKKIKQTDKIASNHDMSPLKYCEQNLDCMEKWKKKNAGFINFYECLICIDLRKEYLKIKGENK